MHVCKCLGLHNLQMKIIRENTEEKNKGRGDEGRKYMFESILVHIIFKEKQEEVQQINECWYQSQVMVRL